MAAEADTATFHPEAERKGKLSILAEQLYFLVRDGDIEKYYYHYGRDRKEITPRTHLTRAQFFRRRDGHNLKMSASGHPYGCVTRDKRLFSWVAEALGYPMPRTLAWVSPRGVTWDGERTTEPFSSLLRGDIDAFCKPTTGTGGWGTMSVRVEAGELFLDGEPASVGDLQSQVDGPCILQERIVQHDAFARLNPDSLNTLRIVTELRDGDASALHVHLRIGREGGVTDNISRGGVVLQLDPETGRTLGDGVVWSSRERWVRVHPDTGVSFAELALPRVPEAVDLVRRFHEDLPYFHTVGWDVAVTPDGLVVIEGNEGWGGGLASVSVPEYAPSFWRWPVDGS